MTSIYRAVVRGHFDNLDEEARTALLAVAGDHDFLQSAFTADGTFTYDERLVAFNLRYEIRFPADESESADAEQQALERATRWLESTGWGFKHLRVSVTDMASMWQD